MRRLIVTTALLITTATLTACADETEAVTPNRDQCARDAWTTWHRDGEVFITKPGHNRPKSCEGLDQKTLTEVADSLALKLIAS